ncbi:MAG: hypothetical protein PVI86_09810 [Phycisphaerae bacterium]|jgi:ABC-type transport system involved in multi-copper enzyme maturation permease subunit
MGPIAALFGFTVRQTLVSRKLWLALLILAVPSVLLIVIRTVEPDVDGEQELWELYHVPAHLFLMHVLVPLVCMVYGTALVASEVEGRTITYLITRRMRRATVLLVQFVATAVALALLCDLAMIGVHEAVLLGRDLPSILGDTHSGGWNPTADLASYLLIIPLAVVAFLAVFTLIGLLAPRPMSVSVVYFIAIELIVANITLRARIYSIGHQLRVVTAKLMPGVPDLYDLPDPLRNELFPSGQTAWPELAAIVLIALALAAVLMTFRELTPAKVARE